MTRNRFDYILARITDKKESFPNGFMIRQYRFGKADITQTPLTEVSAPTMKELGNKLTTAKCLVWDEDRVFGYDGPIFAEGLEKIIYPVSRDDVREYIECNPSD